ncbi:hypothetical protein M378DRAFT_92924, partial [Amanita muscaria Koide BX008]
IAIDVGTTFSGVSYALLDPGIVPQVQPVTQFVGQSEPRGDSKVPSIVCYRQDGTVVAAGAGTDPEMNPELAEMDDVIRVEWFKLHLRPPHLAPSQEFELQKLRSFPKNKTPVQVFGDFLGYLFQSTKKYIIESETWSWNSVEKNTYFVLSHPNGWEGKQQSQMRKAAAAAGLVDKSEALERISFVSEGEASLHFCLNKKPTLSNERDGILIVDCGGGTIDVSAYSQTIKGKFKEITPSECHFQGSIFVTCRAKEYLEQRLRNSKYGSDGEIEAIASSFDKVTKCAFNGPNLPFYVKFGGLSCNDPKFDIRSGSVKIAGSQIASFFEPAIQDIIRLIDDQRSKSTVIIKTVLLVGGFARSNYLFSQLSSHFNNCGVSITRADTTHLNKAVADGAVSYYLDHYVSARVSRYSYGKTIIRLFDPTNPEHARRETTKFMYANGEYYIPGGFDTILKKGTTVSEETQFRRPYSPRFTPEEFSQLTETISSLECYRGEAESPPQWIDLEPNSFHHTCFITADVSNVKKSMTLEYNPLAEKRYYKFDYDVVILFGLTELKAYITWKENVRAHHCSFQNDGD